MIRHYIDQSGKVFSFGEAEFKQFIIKGNLTKDMAGFAIWHKNKYLVRKLVGWRAQVEKLLLWLWSQHKKLFN